VDIAGEEDGKTSLLEQEIGGSRLWKSERSTTYLNNPNQDYKNLHEALHEGFMKLH